jgi:hypothetical protein
MSLSDPVLTPPSGGESYSYGSGSTAELRIDAADDR